MMKIAQDRERRILPTLNEQGMKKRIGLGRMSRLAREPGGRHRLAQSRVSRPRSGTTTPVGPAISLS